MSETNPAFMPPPGAVTVNLVDTAPEEKPGRFAATIHGMSCSSCAQSITSHLASTLGVQARINIATNSAMFDAPPEVSWPQIDRAITDIGFSASQQQHSPASHPSPLPAITAILCAIPVIAMSMVPSLQFPYWQWVALIFSVVCVYGPGWSFHVRAISQLRRARPGMDVLVSLGSTASIILSLAAIFYGPAWGPDYRPGMSVLARPDELHVFVEAAVAIVAFVLIGRTIENAITSSTTTSIASMVNALAPTALRDGQIVSSHELKLGETITVKNGQRVPLDCEVLTGQALIDSAAITGEPHTSTATAGTRLLGGSLVHQGGFTAKVTAVAADSTLALIASSVDKATQFSSSRYRLVDRIVAIFVPSIVALSVTTGLIHALWGASPVTTATIMLTVIVVACPCALGLAIPIALLAGTRSAARAGIMFSSADAIERASKIDTLAVDKTGTLTFGNMQVSSVTCEGQAADIFGIHRDNWDKALAVQQLSSHPIASAMHQLRPPTTSYEVTDFQTHPARGVSATVAGQRIALTPLVEESSTENPESISGLYVDGELQLVITCHDTIDPEARQLVNYARSRGVHVVMLSGDRRAPAAAVAHTVGIDDYRHSLTSDNKRAIVHQFHQQGHTVAMVGDGVNDAAAMTQADVSISVAGATDIAQAASDITVANPGSAQVVKGLRITQRISHVMVLNVWWACAYNAVMIPLAMLGLLTPMMAAAAMSLSSLSVVLHSCRLLSSRTT